MMLQFVSVLMVQIICPSVANAAVSIVMAGSAFWAMERNLSAYALMKRAVQLKVTGRIVSA